MLRLFVELHHVVVLQRECTETARWKNPVSVAVLPCNLWKAISFGTSMFAKPSPGLDGEMIWKHVKWQEKQEQKQEAFRFSK
jgi:hypothetical protein